MPAAQATTLAPKQPHFEVHRSPLAEARADAGLVAFWIILWLTFMVALAPPAQGAASPGRRAEGPSPVAAQPIRSPG